MRRQNPFAVQNPEDKPQMKTEPITVFANTYTGKVRL